MANHKHTLNEVENKQALWYNLPNENYMGHEENLYSTADRVNDFEHRPSFEENSQGLDAH